MTDVQTLIERAAGLWSGEETMIIDPATGQEAGAHGRFENHPAFGGAGFASLYSQTLESGPGISCVTTFSVAEDGAVSAAWIPSGGEPLSFRGHVEDCVMYLERKDADGTEHHLVADYSTPGVMVNTMRIAAPGGPALTVFTGRYKTS